jgi:hypothetical protein
MKNFLLAVSLIFFISFAAGAQKKTQQTTKENAKDVEAAILKLEREDDLATKNGDKIALERLYADDFIGINATGGTSIKKDILTFYAAGGSVLAMNTSDRISVRVFDKTAVVTGRLSFQYNERVPNDRAIYRLRYTKVYLFRSEKWQIVAFHFTNLDESDEDNITAEK